MVREIDLIFAKLFAIENGALEMDGHHIRNI